MATTNELLQAILAELQSLDLPRRRKATGKPGGASVASVTRNTRGEVFVSDDGGDVPTALTPEQRQAMQWQERPHPVGKRRTDTRRVEGRGR